MKTMKPNIRQLVAMLLGLLFTASCSLNDPLENEQIAEETDYTQTGNMVLLIYGAYNDLYHLQWETFPTISVRGDDVNPAGDQEPLIETDQYRYDRNFWMYNSAWLNLYTDLLHWHGAIEEIEKYQEAGANPSTAQQYIAEIKTMQAFQLFQLARLWGSILIPESSQPSHLFNVELSSFEDVMQYISSSMDEAIPLLPNVRPNQRTDIKGGITRHTALAIKAMANLELKNFPAVAEATGQIISSELFTLEEDYYQLFKIPGKLNDENLLEFQYSDYGTGSGNSNRFNSFEFFGPNGGAWTPAVSGKSGGWGFWEPSYKYVKFMLARGERERLQTTVNFTPAGIADLRNDGITVPSWVSNVTPEGDAFGNYSRYKYLSGKYYLPSTQLTAGRTAWGENKNFICIRYAEVLLMHAEALVSGATSSVMTADEAVNAVRGRVGMGALSGVTIDDVLDEKFAEFATEWGIRFYDLMRHGRTSELTYDGRTFPGDQARFLPYPLAQQEIIPQLRDEN
ncbi:MAG TPA: RagB/SusD family nutrient uptake outer membrane protein [Parapedobacter sp.]|uniref:RagB/SusD family nutrient uptake outer membrane protein n=1 Tax=Parapedobacter sp. TaxID=1958893 RepID=UPI002C0FB216|nr:RagB/SusD family nutrient uptake outer membrane protein [Parapedobacter sp.]HWK59373.1 RagB/SusD family nutrient uptake outer membrane protein [Parapedobacter sp.]